MRSGETVRCGEAVRWRGSPATGWQRIRADRRKTTGDFKEVAHDWWANTHAATVSRS